MRADIGIGIGIAFNFAEGNFVRPATSAYSIWARFVFSLSSHRLRRYPRHCFSLQTPANALNHI
jgi:hypothetical protein